MKYIAIETIVRTHSQLSRSLLTGYKLQSKTLRLKSKIRNNESEQTHHFL